MTWVPVQGKVSIVPGEPSAFTSTGLIHLRPYSVAKKRPSSDAGNFTDDGRFAS